MITGVRIMFGPADVAGDPDAFANAAEAILLREFDVARVAVILRGDCHRSAVEIDSSQATIDARKAERRSALGRIRTALGLAEPPHLYEYERGALAPVEIARRLGAIGLTPGALARRLGVPRSTVKRWLDGTMAIRRPEWVAGVLTELEREAAPVRA